MDTRAISEEVTKGASPLSSAGEGSTSVQRLRALFGSVAQEPEIDLSTVVSILRRRKGVLIGTVILVLALTFIVLLQITPLYTASAALMLNTRQTQVVDIQSVMSGLPVNDAIVRSELDVLQSRTLAGRVVDKFGLVKDPEFNPVLIPPGWMAQLHPTEWLPETWIQALGLKVASNELADEGKQREWVIDSFLTHLKVINDGRSYTIRLDFDSKNPETAAQLVNAIADQYLVDQLEAKYDATKRANDWLNERLSDLRQKVRDSDAAVQSYREEARLVENRGETVETQQLSELNSQLVIARVNRAEAEARLRRIRELVRNGTIDSAPEVLSSLLIQQLRQQESELERKLAELSSRFGDRHPSMINTRNELSDLRAKIDAEVKKVAESVANQVEVARSREAALRTSLETLQKNAADLSRAEVKLQELQREADANHALFETFLNRFKQTSTENDNQEADARIISSAAVPSKPSYPKFARAMILSAFGSLALGVLLIIVIERLDNGFRSADQLERVTGISNLALVPRLTRRQLHGLSPHQYALEHLSSFFVEAIQAIRTGIHLSNVDRRPKVVLITSSLAGEGKTTVALTLGRLAASGGQRVLLIDGDLRRPNLGRMLNLDSRKGLQELLAGDADLNEVFLLDEKTGLRIVPSSPSKLGSQDLLSSQRMRQLLAQARSGYDLIIIDSPPIMAVSDALILADLADSVLFLARWETTPRQTVLTAIKHLNRSTARLAGLVMTQVDLNRYSKFGYGDVGYYYVKHGEYYGS